MSAFMPVAIVGMSGRYPGADDLDAFWSNLRGGVDSTGVPLRDIDRWDAAFFGINAREAALLDPQHRIFLECAWHALEDAGCDPARHPGRIGVFAGASLSTYLIGHVAGAVGFAGRPDELAVLLANDKDYLATRVSYLLGLRGPSVGVQTACSTSLVAVHLACRSLACGDCDVAIAGAVTVRVPAADRHQPQEEGYLSRDARCRAFSADAAGTVFGNGAGVVVLKPLDAALVDRDRIRAVIRGSALNNDGNRKIGFVAPSVEGQAALIADALRAAGAGGSDVSYVEAHGTGTALGDPIEIAALTRAFGSDAARGGCAIGSVKTNIGHLESAAGMAGLAKVVLSMEHLELPASLHFDRPNPHIPFGESPFHVNASLRTWSAAGVRRAGVSSFGIGGTNAHVVVEEAPPVPAQDGPREPRAEILVWSGRAEEAVTTLADRYARILREPGPGIHALCAAASQRRAAHPFRAAAVGCSRGEMADRVGAIGAGNTSAGTARGRAEGQRRIAFVYAGQGGQWAGMGRELYEQEPEFRIAVDACDLLVREIAGWSVLAELQSGERTASCGESIETTQTAVFAVQIGLTALWRSWGIAPAAVVGHSMGEVAAAAASGALSMRDAVELIAVRGRFIDAARGSGGMLAVELDADQAENEAACEPDVAIAAINGPQAVVFSGPLDALARIAARLTSREARTRWLQTGGVAGHSAAVSDAADRLAAWWSGRAGSRPVVPWVSTVTAEWVSEGVDAEYWRANVRETVRFGDAVRQLAAGGCDAFLEIGPHAVLGPAVAQQLDAIGHDHIVFSSLRRDAPERETMLTSLAALYCAGCEVDWNGVYPGPAAAVRLPLYPFQRQRYWIEEHALAHESAPPLPGRRLDSARDEGEHYWQSALTAGDPAVAGHRVDGTVVAPATLLLSAAAAAAIQVTDEDAAPIALEDVTFLEPLVLPSSGAREVQIQISRGGDGSMAFRISSRAGDAWTLHVTGTARGVTDFEDCAIHVSIADTQGRCRRERPGDRHYAALRERGIENEGPFRAIDVLRLGSGEAIGSLAASGGSGLPFDPSPADAALQALEALLDGPSHELYVPRSVDRVIVRRGGVGAFVHASLTSRRAQGSARGDAMLLDADGLAIVEMRGVALQRVARLPSSEGGRLDGAMALRWDAVETQTAARARESSGWWLIVEDRYGIGRAMAERLGVAICELSGDGREGRTDAEAYRRLFRTSAAARGEAPGDVLYLRAIDGRSVQDAAAGARDACVEFLGAVQALDVFGDAPPRLTVVTTGAQYIADTAARAASGLIQLPVVAMTRTIVHEHRELACRAIDLPAEPGSHDLDVLGDLLRRDDLPSESAIRHGVVQCPRLQAADLDASRPACGSSGAWLLSGGLGGLGLEVAEHLVENGAAGLVLLGRRDPSPGASARIERWRSRGVDVRVTLADVTRAHEVDAAVTTAVRHFGGLSGVVHLACVLDDGLLEGQTGARLEAVFDPKAAGAWHLHGATRGIDLDAFVLFSSAGALLGSPGQVTYVAANAFLDALAAHRRSCGLPAVSIAWGNWSDAGRSAGEAAQARLEARGWRGLPTAEALEIFARVLRGSPPGVCVPHVDLGRWTATHPSAARSTLWRYEAGTPKPARRRPVLASLRDSIAAVLGAPVRDADCRRPFQSLGLDSLRALELRTRLEHELGVRIPATSFWRHPTAERLAEALEHQVGR